MCGWLKVNQADFERNQPSLIDWQLEIGRS